MVSLSEELVGREEELRHVLSYMTAGENRVNLVTKARGGGLNSYVFGLPSFVRSVQSFLADRSFPLLLLEGEPGCGKSALLDTVAARAAELPGLRILQGSDALAVLRRLYDGIDDATDDELLLMPVVRQAGQQGGVVLLLDGLDSAPWLPLPLPLGVRCVISTGAPVAWAGEASVRHLRLPSLPLSAVSQMRLRLQLAPDSGTASSCGNPLWLVLASRLHRETGHVPKSLELCVQALITVAEGRFGEDAVCAALSAVSCSRAGLRTEELDGILATHGTPWGPIAGCLEAVLHTDAAEVQLKRLLGDVVEQRYLQAPEARRAWHERLASFFSTHGDVDAERRVEAAFHLDALGAEAQERLLELLADWSVFSILERQQLSALVGYCRSAGGYTAVSAALQKRALCADGSAARKQERRVTVGRFLSHVGQFAAAKEILLAARREALPSPDRMQTGEICTLIAENEVRYWDSLRNWSTVEALTDLLEASSTAVEIFKEVVQSQGRVWARAEYAKALTRWANGCFKAACVCGYNQALEYLAKADDAVAKVQSLFVGSPPSRIEGRALLVGGVAMLVRGHLDEKFERPYRHTLVRAAKLLQDAQRQLVLAVGEVNESSIYTHANLAELYLHDIGHIPNALYHNLHSCLVGIRLWGPGHPNVERKLMEFSTLMEALHANPLAEAARQGDVHVLSTTLNSLSSQSDALQCDLEVWAAEDPFRSLR